MLRGSQLRVDINDQVDRVQPHRELAVLFNDWTMDFQNYFENYPNGDDDLRGIDPNNCNVKRTDTFLKGNSTPFNFECLEVSLACVTILRNNGFTTKQY